MKRIILTLLFVLCLSGTGQAQWFFNGGGGAGGGSGDINSVGDCTTGACAGTTFTWGAGSAITWTYNASAGTDCTMAWGNETNTITCTTVTIAGKLITTASAAVAGAGFNLPHGVAPNTPTNGDCWSTTAGLYCQINGSTIGPYAAAGGSPALDDVTNPDAAKTFTLLDNQASSLSFGATGAADILKIGTLDAGAGVTVTGFLTNTGLGTFGTLSAGAGGFTVDADGDVVGKSFTSTQGATGSIITLLEGTGGGTNFRKLSVPDALTADLNLQHANALPTANQFHLYPAPTTGVSQYAWQTYGTFTGLTVILPSSDADPATTAGTIRHDSSDTGANSGGSLKHYDGAQVRTLVDTGTNYTILVKTEYIPIQYAEDGATAPTASAVTASTRKVRTRDFSGSADQDVEIHWMVPDDYVGGVKWRFIGYVTNATAPANTEIVAFSLAGCSNGDSDVLGCTAGTAQTSSLTADATYVQYDRLAGVYSSELTITNIAAGESAHLKLMRLATTTDTYGQAFGLAGIEIKYKAKIIGIAGY